MKKARQNKPSGFVILLSLYCDKSQFQHVGYLYQSPFFYVRSAAHNSHHLRYSSSCPGKHFGISSSTVQTK